MTARCAQRLHPRGVEGRIPMDRRRVERAAARRGVRSAPEGYDAPALPTRPAVLRACAGGAIVHGVPGSRAPVESDVVGLDFAVTFGGSLALHGEHGVLLTDRGAEAPHRIRGPRASAGESET